MLTHAIRDIERCCADYKLSLAVVCTQASKIVDNSKARKVSRILSDILYHLVVLFICISKNLHFTSPLRLTGNTNGDANQEKDRVNPHFGSCILVF